MRKSILSVVALGLLAIPGTVGAAPITGFIALSGGITYDTLEPSPPGSDAILDFEPEGGGTGSVLKVSASSGYFASVNTGTTAQILDLTNELTAAGVPGPAYAPPGPVNVVNFLSAFSDPDVAGLHFDLTEIVIQSGFTACDGTEGLGDTCLLGGVFILNESEEGLSVDFDILGYFRRGIDEGYFKGTFGSAFVDMTFSQLYALLAAGENVDCPDGVTPEGRIPCSFTVNFTPVPQDVVPEPATLLLLGTGLLGAGYRNRRRFTR